MHKHDISENKMYFGMKNCAVFSLREKIVKRLYALDNVTKVTSSWAENSFSKYANINVTIHFKGRKKPIEIVISFLRQGSGRFLLDNDGSRIEMLDYIYNGISSPNPDITGMLQPILEMEYLRYPFSYSSFVIG